MSENAEPLPVGPELDAAVAQVLGWTVAPSGSAIAPTGWTAEKRYRYGLPAFSLTAGHAWEVMEYLQWRKCLPVAEGDAEGWRVTIWPPSYHREISAQAPTMPEAVCRAVLLAAYPLQEKLDA